MLALARISLERFVTRSRLTREALADVDAGRVIAHQAVQAWADSLNTDRPLPLAALMHLQPIIGRKRPPTGATRR